MVGLVPPYRIASSPSESLEDEPWDQRYSSVPNTTVVTDVNSMTPRYSSSNTYSRQKQQAMGARVADGEDLDDGDLPSLSSRGYANVVTPNHSSAAAVVTAVPVGGRIVGGQTTTSRPLKPSSDNGLTTPSPTSGRRKFWGQMEQSDNGPSFDDADVAEKLDARGAATRRPSKNGRDEDGPEDEVAARRHRGRSSGAMEAANQVVLPANSTMTSNQSQMKEYDTDNSVPTDVDSQLTEEEEDESRYETTFCGQTLNAIGDICGGGGLLIMGGSRSPSKENFERPPVSTVDSSTGNRALRKSRSPSLRDESQQENTAIEVEFVEPIKPAAKAAIPDDGHGTVDPQKKNAYLTAMAKKAKENFQNKKSKQVPKLSQRDVVPIERTSPLPTLQGMTSLIDVEESATDIASSVNAKYVAGVDAKRDLPDGDSDYNSFNATEKRKFIKLINGGIAAGDATRHIMEERSISRREKDLEQKRSHAVMEKEKDQGQLKAAKISARLPFWKRSGEAETQVASASADLQNDYARAIETERSSPTLEAILAEANFPQVEEPLEDILADAQFPDVDETDHHFLPTQTQMEHDPIVQQAEAMSVSDVDSIPFEKSGSHYYDAVRQDYDEESSMSLDGGQRGLDFSKTLEMARSQRFFGVAKSKGKGFTALPNSPVSRSSSVPRQRLALAGVTSQLTGHHQLDDASYDRSLASAVDIESEFAGTLTVGAALSNLEGEQLRSQELFVEPQADEALQHNELSAANAVGREIEPVFITPTASADDDEDASAFQPKGDTRTEVVEEDLMPIMGPTWKPPISERLLETSCKDEVITSLTEEPNTITPSTPKQLSREPHLDSDDITPPTPRSREIDSKASNLDVSMDTYFKSTNDAYSVAESVYQSDAVSVYTTGTTATGITSYTQSSRIRRPGVGKTRLAKQKQIEQRIAKRGQGWHETIRSAAESAQRTWDPKNGWIDYEEPDIVSVAPFPVAKEKIRIDLDRSVLSHKGMETSDQDVSREHSVVPVPFPEEWQKERDAMIQGVAPKEPLAPQSGLETKSRTVEEKAGFITGQIESNDQRKSKGWVESMRAASASLAKEGKAWDPVHGWSSVTKSDYDVPNTVDFDIPSYNGSTPIVKVSGDAASAANDSDVLDHDHDEIHRGNASNKLANLVLSYPDDDLMLVDDNQMQTYGDIQDVGENSDYIPPTELLNKDYDDVEIAVAPLGTTNAIMNVISVGEASSQCQQGPLSLRTSEVLDGHPLPQGGDKLNRWIAKKADMAPKSLSELSTEHSDLAVVSGTSAGRCEPDIAQRNRSKSLVETELEKSVPFLGRIGINSHQTEIEEYDTAPSIVHSGEFPMHEEISVVDVVKEKVNERDMDLFSEDSKSPRNNRQRYATSVADVKPSVLYVDRGVSSYESPDRIGALSRTSPSVMSADMSVATSRRGGGPIDTDEVDETWDSDDDERHSQGWLPNTSRGGKSGGGDVSHSMQSTIPEDGDDHQHIKGWKENGTISMTQSSRNASGHSSDARINSSALTNATPLKRVPRLERSKRDTSPLSDRKVVDADFSVRDEDLIHNVSSLQRDLSPLRFRDERAIQNEFEPFEEPDPVATTSSAEPASFKAPALAELASFAASALVEQTAPPPNMNVDDISAQDNFPASGASSRMGRTRQSASLSATDRHILGDLTTPPGSNHGDRSHHSNFHNEIHSPESPSVKDRLREWETRIEASYSADACDSVEPRLQNESLSPGGMEGWRSFLGKKVQAVSAAAVAAHKGISSEVQERKQPESHSGGAHPGVVKRTQTDEDSLFEFVNKKGVGRDGPLALDISDLSPINANDDLSEADYAESGYGPTEEERRSSSFLQRLSECAAPIMSSKQSQGESFSASGSFLKPASSSIFMPTALCGKQDILDEPESVDNSHESLNTAEKHRRSMSFGDEKPRSKSKSRDKIKPETIRVSTSSVVSEDFGAKTAFLDSVAMKAAVSKSRRSRSTSRKHDRSGDSSVASGSTIHSEKWKSFLERKRASDPSPVRSRASSSDVSKAAEKYASQKVDEIMTKMASRSKTVTRSRDVHKEVNTEARVHDNETSDRRTRSTVNDAEDLAAARVEAMMAALSSSHLDEGEI